MHPVGLIWRILPSAKWASASRSSKTMLDAPLVSLVQDGRTVFRIAVHKGKKKGHESGPDFAGAKFGEIMRSA
ncbi:MAG: hypothetical protein CM1200mP20_00800 [Pseudomonadota bacterium]|nr:MAG: hypothetical protein CM1200mP20_00800 [Pseudomonadota bacterium]